MNNYKIIATDLDGTLLNNRADISCENIRAISELSKKGVHVVPASGRSFSEMPEKVKNHPDIRYFICSNGASVFDKKTGDKKTFCIQKDALKEIFGILKSYEVHISVRQDGKLLVDSRYQTDEDFLCYNVCEPHQVVVKDFGVYVDNLEEFCLSRDNIEVVSVFFKNLREKQECKNVLEKNQNIFVTGVDDFNLEIFDKYAGKDNALKCFADMMGVEYSRTISIGDSDNDISITKFAGLGLATSNACDSLKKVSDKIICSNEENVMEHILLNCFKK